MHFRQIKYTSPFPSLPLSCHRYMTTSVGHMALFMFHKTIFFVLPAVHFEHITPTTLDCKSKVITLVCGLVIKVRKIQHNLTSTSTKYAAII